MPDIPAVWTDDEYWLPETEEYINRIKNSGVNVYRIKATIEHCSWFTAYEGKNLPDSRDIAQKYNWQGVFLGVRAEESLYRKRLLKVRSTIWYSTKYNQWQSYPLAWWKTEDIRAYIFAK